VPQTKAGGNNRWRYGLALSLALIAAAVVWLWITSTIHPKTPKTKPGKPFTDLGVTMPLDQPGGGPAPSEAYPVYSSLYQTPMPEPLAFAEDSNTDIPQVNGSCLRPATPQEQEMADAFVAANQQSHRWERKFSIAQGYELLPNDEVDQAQTCLANHQHDGAQCEKYRQFRYVRLLAVPGFDHAHTHALVSVIKSCGRFCGSGGIFAVEKTTAAWQRSPATDFTRDCSWMY
jgi:hypothetical protein